MSTVLIEVERDSDNSWVDWKLDITRVDDNTVQLTLHDKRREIQVNGPELLRALRFLFPEVS